MLDQMIIKNFTKYFPYNTQKCNTSIITRSSLYPFLNRLTISPFLHFIGKPSSFQISAYNLTNIFTMPTPPY